MNRNPREIQKYINIYKQQIKIVCTHGKPVYLNYTPSDKTEYFAISRKQYNCEFFKCHKKIV